MAEALISSLIQKLESRGAEMPEYVKGEMGGVIAELIILLDCVRDKRFGEGSSQYCSIREVVEMAEDALVPNELKGVFAFLKEVKSVKSLLGQTKMRIFQSGIDGATCSVGSREVSSSIPITCPSPPQVSLGRTISNSTVQITVTDEDNDEGGKLKSCLNGQTEGLSKSKIKKYKRYKRERTSEAIYCTIPPGTATATDNTEMDNLVESFENKINPLTGQNLDPKKEMEIKGQLLDEEQRNKETEAAEMVPMVLRKLVKEVMRAGADCDRGQVEEEDLYYLDVSRGTEPVEGWLREMKVRMIMYGLNSEEAEALIARAIQAMEPYHLEFEGEANDITEIMDDLVAILDFLRCRTAEEWSGLNCLICDVVEMAVYLDVSARDYTLFDTVSSLERWRQVIKLRMFTSGVDGEEDPEALILWVIEHLEFQICYKEEIEGVINELRAILDFLREEKTVEDRRRLNYSVCDLIEMVLYLGDVKENIGTTCFIFGDVESVQIWLQNLRLCMLKLRLSSPSGVDVTVKLENVGEADEEDAVGLDEQVELFLETTVFNEEEGYFRTLLITGMVGVGKTILARNVYNHAAVVGWFERRAWLHFSTDLTRKEILIILAQQLVHNDQLHQTDSSLILEKMDNANLKHMLHRHLRGTAYFIVLDGLPKQMNLNFLLDALPRDDQDKGSRLLVTSITADVQPSTDYIHQVKPLDSDNSWELFLNTVFRGNELRSEEKFPKHLINKGREMLSKCGGLPLAIKALGMQFAEKRRTGSEWEELLESIDWDPTLALLENFYQQLDQEQKSCFLHLALFKECTTTRADKLFHVLVAGGLASETDQLMSYLTRLNDESVVEFEYGTMGQMKGCTINPVLHKLSIRKAEQEIGFEIMRKDGNYRPSQSHPRYRVINCSRETFNYSTDQDNYLVSLVFRGGGYLEAAPTYWKSFELLKTLDLEDFGLKILPESVGTLIELRYLGLRNNYLRKLPHSIVCLKKLEILDIALNFMVEVPDILCDISSLLCIYKSDAIFQTPFKIDALKKLTNTMHISVDNLAFDELSSFQTMTSVEKLGTQEEDGPQMISRCNLETVCGIEEVDGLETMSTLGIEEDAERMTIHKRLSIDNIDGNVDGSKLLASLAELDGLENLMLKGFRFRGMPCLDGFGSLRSLTTLKLNGLLPMLPNDFPPELYYLKLVDSCLDQDPMPVLQKLWRLRQLTLKNAYTGQCMIISGKRPSDLHTWHIEELWNLKTIHVGEDGMKWLYKLEIHNCPLLETLPQEIARDMHRLDEFNMTTTKKIAAKIRESGSISEISMLRINP